MDQDNREIWVKEDRLFLYEDNVLLIKMVGYDDEKTANAIKEASLKLVNTVDGKVDVCIDINRSKKPSPEARKIWKVLSEHDKFRKVALFGVHPVSEVIASFVIRNSKKKDFRFFKSKEEALSWLRRKD